MKDKKNLILKCLETISFVLAIIFLVIAFVRFIDTVLNYKVLVSMAGSTFFKAFGVSLIYTVLFIVFLISYIVIVKEENKANGSLTRKFLTIVKKFLYIFIPVFLVLLIVVIGSGLYVAQDIVVFHPDFNANADYYLTYSGDSYKRIEYETEEGQLISGWMYRTSLSKAPTIIYYCGNEQSAAQVTFDFSQQGLFSIMGGLNFCVMDYPRYGKSTGDLTEEAIQKSCLEAFDYITTGIEFVNKDEIILLGYSLGTSFASYVAKERKVLGLVLVAPFTNASDLYNSYLKVFGRGNNQFIKYSFDTEDYAKKISNKTLIIASLNDDVVDYDLSCQVAKKFVNHDFITIENEDHNHLLKDETLLKQVKSFIDGLGIVNHVFRDYIYNNDATCEKDGTETAICIHPGCYVTDTRVKVGSALGHLFGEYVFDNNATCTSSGTETARCTRDGCTHTNTRVKEGPFAPHSYSAWVVIKDPTMLQEGIIKRTCSLCGQIDEEYIPILSNSEVYSITESKASTCVTKGYDIYTSEYGSFKLPRELVSHTYLDWTTLREPTLTALGLRAKICSVCGASINEDVPKLSNTSIYSITETVASTCIDHGYRLYSSTEYGDFKYNLPIVSHNFTGEHNDCLYCGASYGLKYTYNKDLESYSVSTIPININYTVIPEYYNDGINGKHPVTGIDCMIGLNYWITSLIIPDSITYIKDGAFTNCKKLVHITNLSQVNLVSGTHYTDRDYFEIRTSLDTAFLNELEVDKNGLSIITVGNVKTVLSFYCSTNAASLNYLVGDAGYTYQIEDYAFYKLQTVVTIIFPKFFTTISSKSIDSCVKFNTLFVAQGTTVNIDMTGKHLYYYTE